MLVSDPGGSQLPSVLTVDARAGSTGVTGVRQAPFTTKLADVGTEPNGPIAGADRPADPRNLGDRQPTLGPTVLNSAP